jgi:hypothetical protein
MFTNLFIATNTQADVMSQVNFRQLADLTYSEEVWYVD